MRWTQWKMTEEKASVEPNILPHEHAQIARSLCKSRTRDPRRMFGSSGRNALARMVSPALARLRTSYAGLADKRGEGREALSLYRTLQDIRRRRDDLDKSD